jgi:aryl-alcohol dehydrogenase-like predicted oxidoreductase
LFDRTVAIDKPVVDRLAEVAQQRELPASQIALAWMLRNPASPPQSWARPSSIISLTLSPPFPSSF